MPKKKKSIKKGGKKMKCIRELEYKMDMIGDDIRALQLIVDVLLVPSDTNPISSLSGSTTATNYTVDISKFKFIPA
jgi:hypothetical protein